MSLDLVVSRSSQNTFSSNFSRFVLVIGLRSHFSRFFLDGDGFVPLALVISVFDLRQGFFFRFRKPILRTIIKPLLLLVTHKNGQTATASLTATLMQRDFVDLWMSFRSPLC